MKVSTKAHYGLKVVISVSQLYKPGVPVSVTDIAREEGVTEAYVEQLVAKLRHAGILKSYRGAHGGYMLAKDPDSITVADVMAAAGEQVVFPECTAPCGCILPRRSTRTCASTHFWQRLCLMVTGIVERTTVGDLIRESENCDALRAKESSDAESE